MFTLEQINEAHREVKSGTDFPRYVQSLIGLGVEKYDTYVFDGHSEYFDAEGNSIHSTEVHEVFEIALASNKETFLERLKAHQNGETDYRTFSRDAADAGVEKWTVDTKAMTCTYYDKAGNELLKEIIPTV